MKTQYLSEKDKNALADLNGLDVKKYLSIYTEDIDWEQPLQELRSMQIDAAEKWKRIAFTILLPTQEPNAFKNVSLSNIFNWCFKWQQFNSSDWIYELSLIFKEDQKIEIIRKKCLDLGIIYPIVYNPTTRQAYNWLLEAAKENHRYATTFTGKESQINEEKLQNLVFIYGGSNICSIFNKPELAGRIKRIPNWRTGYFFEKILNSVYTETQLIDIKTHEINRLVNSGSNLVKYLAKEKTNDNF